MFVYFRIPKLFLQREDWQQTLPGHKVVYFWRDKLWGNLLIYISFCLAFLSAGSKNVIMREQRKIKEQRINISVANSADSQAAS